MILEINLTPSSFLSAASERETVMRGQRRIAVPGTITLAGRFLVWIGTGFRTFTVALPVLCDF